MKIVSSLLITLCVSSSIMGNESDPFKQKTSDQSNILNDGAKNKYKISGGQILKRANIAQATAGFGIAFYGFYKNGFHNLPQVLVFTAAPMLNGASASFDAKKNSKASTVLGIANAVWGLGWGLCQMALYVLSPTNPIPIQFTVYWGVNTSLNLVNAAYRLYWIKKQQS